jgi:UDP-N-acetyl-D-galactosamine dehydrogenase
VILAGRDINDSMGMRIAREVVQYMIQQEVVIKKSRVLVMGATFKENISDIRNSKVADIVNELNSYLVKLIKLVNLDKLVMFLQPL